jgi:non-specific serine/threonine protein kinase
MTPERHARLQSIFLAASQRSGSDRGQYLDEACSEDPELRREVEELLAFNTTQAGGSLTDLHAALANVAGRASGGFEIGTVLDGKIRIEGLVGEGGMGTVFRGVQLALERPVAIKVIRPALVLVPGLVERLRREALAVARLRHPNVIAIYDFCSSEQAGAYLVMEFVEGESLAAALEREGQFAPSYAVAVLRQICGAVQTAHDVGVIHRDLKPQNILLEPPATAPRVRVLDFGIAKLVESATTEQPLSAEGHLIGTPLYMSPEQASGLPVDARTDVYALGCILYELVTGRPPFVGPGVAKILIDHTTREPKPPSRREAGVPAWLDAVTLNALEKDPADRFQSAAELASALAEGLQEMSEARASARATRVAAPAPARSRLARPCAPNNLPTPATSFVGRERDIADVVAALAAAPLVTLTGPGGVGKTRLAIRAASELLARAPDADDAPDELWFVDLAPASSRAGVTGAVASVLDLRTESEPETVVEIARRLGRRRALLVLDNCEHVTDAAAALVTSLLAACSDLRVLATSRASLGVAGEAIHPIAALGLPGPSASSDEAAASEAVVLFIERAQLVSTVFRVTTENYDVVADICRQLDGLPLAIELAAARARILTVHQIRDRLRDRLRLLRSTATTGRHESLRAAIDWSYNMLGTGERMLFDRLSVFSGGFTIDAIEAVCADDAVDAVDALDILAGLVDKSLVTVTHAGREARYFLLDTVRAYAREKLAACGDADRFRARHRDYFLEFSETAAKKLHGREGAEWGARLQGEIDNLRAALAWSRDEVGDGLAFLRLATALHVFFYERGYLGEGRVWIDAALERAGDVAPAELRTLALTGVGNLAHDQGDLAAARAYQERALAINREVGDRAGVASALHNIGNILLLVGDYARARAHFEESLAICREMNRPHNVALSLFTQACVAVETAAWDRADELLAESDALYASIGHTFGLSLVRTEQAYEAMVRGQLDRIEPLLAEALALAQAVEHRHNVATVAAYRANVARYLGRFDDAEARGAEALETFRALGDKDCSSMMLYVLARAARQRGDHDVAAARLKESLALRTQLGLRKGLAECYEETAALASAHGDAATAARLLGAAADVRATIGAPVQPIDEADRAALRDAARMALGDESFNAARAVGVGLSACEVLGFISSP